MLNVVGILLGLAAATLGVISLVTGKRTSSGTNGLAITAVAIGGFAVVGAVAVLSVYSSNSSGSTSASLSKDTNSPVASPSQSATSMPSPTAAATPPPSGSAAQPHALGTVALLGKEYQAAVTGVKLNANADIAANNRYNDSPEGQYVLVDIAVTFVGSGEGTPWLDLSPVFVGSDARQYDASSCGASLTNGEMDVPTLEPGGSATYQVCMDVPTGAIEGGKVFIENDWSYRDQRRTYWAVR